MGADPRSLHPQGPRVIDQLKALSRLAQRSLQLLRTAATTKARTPAGMRAFVSVSG